MNVWCLAVILTQLCLFLSARAADSKRGGTGAHRETGSGVEIHPKPYGPQNPKSREERAAGETQGDPTHGNAHLCVLVCVMCVSDCVICLCVSWTSMM